MIVISPDDFFPSITQMSFEKLITYRCPTSDAVVDHRMDASSTSRQIYQPVVCGACGQLHFVHRDSGKLLGQERDPGRDEDDDGGQSGR